ncbi:BamA/TamA family outer membrane protein [Carboxylicivirga sp. M1479]|uniref:BamA/TamA family outer membrane protein n=1 Tax=Carboxylicivirga sp. M1479 TaxID=2594476 RepID=UPI00117782F4|nr:BamA/TamA family outer membrane protein [Carboxylicivirga sp. M1479]TRX63294.1 BamA/TamA family outer membrane protein [Carboxylicivirga sp. M1479]
MTIRIILIFLLLILSLPYANALSKKDSTDKKVDFVPVPYINYNRTGGFEFGGVPMAMYQLNSKDSISPPSMTGLVGKYSTEGNWVIIAFQRMYWKQNNWRLVFAAGMASNGFQYYSEINGEIPIDYTTTAAFAYMEIQRRIYKKLYGGLVIISSVTDTEFDNDSNSKRTYFNTIGTKFSVDLRNNVYYPSEGLNDNFQWTSTPDFLDNEFVGQRIEIDHNQYFPFNNKRDVFAWRLMTGFSIGSTAFERQFIVGRNDLRGYTQGEYRGESIATLQGEYRWNPYKKIGFVGFAGLATIWGAEIDDNNGKILPSIGTGFRYNVFPKNHMNIGMEAAVGIDDWGIYFRIGEAF